MIHSIMPTNKTARRTGFTLVELLVVIGIGTLLAAIVLPTFKAVLKNRKINQTALQVRSFIELAKARAVSEQRDVAVILYRDQNIATSSEELIDVNRVTRLGFAEVLPAYRGDFPNSICRIVFQPLPDNNVVPPRPAGWYAIINIDSNPTADFNIQNGDFISIGDNGLDFPIEGKFHNTQLNNLEVLFANPPISASALASVGDRPPVNLPYNRSASRGQPDASPSVAFQVTPRPRRLFNRPLELPKDTCIDLSLSGAGIAGNGFYANQPLDAAGLPIFYAPLYLVINEDGVLSEIITSDLGGNITRALPTGDLYLHIGRGTQVDLPPVDPSVTYVEPTGVSERDTFQANFFDPANYWLRISPISGGTSTSVTADAATLTAGIPFANALTQVRGAAAQAREDTIE